MKSCRSAPKETKPRATTSCMKEIILKVSLRLKKDFDSLNLSHIKTSINSKGKTTYIGTGANGTTYNLHWSSTESRGVCNREKLK